ncbi:MAG: ABC transporter permease, partial [Pyrinomonadaceae bacterium]
ARFTAASATLGIAGGVGALIVALALANGFRDEMRDKILRGTAHITAARADGYPLTNWRDVAAQLRVVPGVVTVSATSYDGALVAGADQATYAVLRGVDTENRAATLELRRVLIDGELDLRPAVEAKKESTPSHITEESGASNFSSFDGATHDFASLPTAVIGAELAARTNLRVGDTGKIISAGAALADPESVPRQQRVRIAGVFRTGLYEYDATWIYISLVTAADLVGAPLSASAMSIEIADPERVAEAAAAVRARLGEKFVVVDWREANRPLFAALSLERRVILTIIALIVMVAALNIATALALLVIERRPDIAILGALGARPRT